MIDLSEDSLSQLEFDKVLLRVSEFTYSPMAALVIKELIPSQSDEKGLEYEFSLIAEGIDIIGHEDRLPFEGFSDISGAISKSNTTGSILTVPEIISINETIRSFRLFQFYFRSIDHKYPVFAECVSGFYSNRLLEKHINETIDETGEIKDTASRELQRIRSEIKETSSRLRSRLEKIIKRNTEPGHIQEDYISVRDGRFIIPVKAESKRIIPGIIHGMSQTGSTVFLEPSEVFELNNTLSLLANEEKNEVLRLLRDLTEEIGNDSVNIMATYEKLLFVDTIIARSRYAAEYHGIKPEILSEGNISLDDCRHPLLVHKMGRDQVVPMNILFTKEKTGFLISGPNAGGKTVAMKTVGLNLAMALSGIYPIGKCSTPFIKIYTAIGDHQSIENDLSTFSSQIKRIKDILEQADSDSLVLIDEILSGTDPYEGAALASGVLETFALYKVNFIVTTHQSALKTFALNNPAIENASLEYDDINLRPTYRFLAGVPGNSYAFYLAKGLGLNEKLLERASAFQSDKEGELEQSISILSKYRSEAIQSRIESDLMKREHERLAKKYEKKIDDINAKRSLFITNAQNEAEKILHKANSLIENTIREIRESEKAKSSVNYNTIKKKFEQSKTELKEEIQKLAPATNKNVNQEARIESELNIGDTVVLKNGTEKGTILKEIGENEILVEFNGLKIKTDKKKLRKADNIRYNDTNEYVIQTKISAASRIDVRGMRAHAAIELIDKKISDSLLENIPLITIVHGKGTGALRESIQEFLRFHHHVPAFRSGTIEEGGSGVTILEFEQR